MIVATLMVPQIYGAQSSDEEYYNHILKTAHAILDNLRRELTDATVQHTEFQSKYESMVDSQGFHPSVIAEIKKEAEYWDRIREYIRIEIKTVRHNLQKKLEAHDVD